MYAANLGSVLVEGTSSRRNYGGPNESPAQEGQREEGAFWRTQSQGFRVQCTRKVGEAGRALARCMNCSYHRLISVLIKQGQRKAPTRPARRPPPRRSTPHHRRRRWPLRRRQNHAHQEPDPPLHQANPLLAVRTPHSRHIQAPPPHVHRMPVRLAGQHDRHRQGR